MNSLNRIHPVTTFKQNLLMLRIVVIVFQVHKEGLRGEKVRDSLILYIVTLNGNSIFNICGLAVCFIMLIVVFYLTTFWPVSGRCWTSWSTRSHWPSRSSCKDSGLLRFVCMFCSIKKSFFIIIFRVLRGYRVSQGNLESLDRGQESNFRSAFFFLCISHSKQEVRQTLSKYQFDADHIIKINKSSIFTIMVLLCQTANYCYSCKYAYYDFTLCSCYIKKEKTLYLK